jgi:hypothetical protein
VVITPFCDLYERGTCSGRIYGISHKNSALQMGSVHPLPRFIKLCVNCFASRLTSLVKTGKFYILSLHVVSDCQLECHQPPFIHATSFIHLRSVSDRVPRVPICEIRLQHMLAANEHSRTVMNMHVNNNHLEGITYICIHIQ